jgi:hypothetical protein
MNTRAPDNPNVLVPFAPTSKTQPEAKPKWLEQGNRGKPCEPQCRN